MGAGRKFAAADWWYDKVVLIGAAMTNFRVGEIRGLLVDLRLVDLEIESHRSHAARLG
jgi:hypothetical protein